MPERGASRRLLARAIRELLVPVGVEGAGAGEVVEFAELFVGHTEKSIGLPSASSSAIDRSSPSV